MSVEITVVKMKILSNNFTFKASNIERYILAFITMQIHIIEFKIKI